MVDMKELAAIHFPKCDLGGIACIEQMFCVRRAHRASDGKLFDVVFFGTCGHAYGVLPLANLSE